MPTDDTNELLGALVTAAQSAAHVCHTDSIVLSRAARKDRARLRSDSM